MSLSAPSIASIGSDSSGFCSSETMSTCSSSSPLKDLPQSSYDGSHLHWKTFRQHILSPHRIRIVEGPPRERLPETLLAFIEAQSKNIERFDEQKQAFRAQVTSGRGFGPSPLFPPNLLPSIDDEPQLARCMIPTFSRDALPERALNQLAPLYEISIPRPGLGCGFGSFAFTNEELAALPTWLAITGTTVDFDTGFISPSSAICCPFLTFERTYGNKEHRMEAANNKCAIDGAWCCRALQMFYAKAHEGERFPPMPVAFSCAIDNECAIINYHWIDHAQAYYMSPLCRFDLGNDEHFNHFVAWVDAIGQWAVTSLLPQIKDSLEKLRNQDIALASPPQLKTPKNLTLTTGETKNDLLIKSLKTTFEEIPWRFEDDEFTPVSSSTASWGSPMIDDMIFSNMTYANAKVPPKLIIPESDTFPGTPRPSLADKRMSVPTVPPNTALGSGQSPPPPPPPPPAYTQNPELVWQKRFNHSMEEIKDLQAQMQALRQGLTGSSTSFRRELSGMRSTLSSVLRKESVMARSRSLSMGQNLLLQANAEGQSPTSPISRHRLPPPRLQLPTAKPSTNPRTRLQKISLPPTSPTVTLSMNGVDLVLSPKEISMSLDVPKTPFTALPRSPLSEISTQEAAQAIVSEPATPVTQPTSTSLWSKLSPQAQSAWQWTGTLVSGYVLGALVPSSILSMIILGCAANWCLSNSCGFNIKQLRMPYWRKKSINQNKGLGIDTPSK